MNSIGAIALYEIEHRATGRKYIGISRQPIVRFRQHVQSAHRKCTTKFQRALRKHGAEAFDFSILGWCETLPQAKRAEILLIHILSPHYNTTRGGDGAWGRKASPETCRKMSASQAGKKHSSTTRAKISEVQRGKKISAETIQKIVESWTPTKREEMRQQKLSFRHTEEAKARIRQNNRHGEDGVHAVLTEGWVRCIRALRREGLSYEAIVGEVPRLTKPNCARICTGQTWKHSLPSHQPPHTEESQEDK